MIKADVASYINQIIHIIPWEGSYTYSKRGNRWYFIKAWASLLYNTYKTIKRYGISYQKPAPGRTVVFYVESQNQYNSLRPIIDRFKDDSVVIRHPWLKIGHAASEVPLAVIYILAVLFYPFTFFQARKLFPIYEGKFNKNHILVYGALGMAGYVISRRLLKAAEARMVVVSNDHLFIPVSMIYAARERHMKSVYVQHAHVSPAFPPLCMDYALLDGTVAERTYRRIGVGKDTTIALIGMMKSDGLVRYKKVSGIRNVGICINGVDDLSKIDAMIRHIHEYHPDLNIHVRLHPIMPKDYHMDSFAFCTMSDHRGENVFAFLKRIDLLVCGESSVHVEAALMNMPSFYYNTFHRLLDDYGFVKDGLVSALFDDPRRFSDYLATLDVNQDFSGRAKPYCDTIGTAYENRSTERAIVEINGILGKS